MTHNQHRYILGRDTKPVFGADSEFRVNTEFPGLADGPVPMLPIVSIDNDTKCGIVKVWHSAFCQSNWYYLLLLNRKLEALA